MNNVSGNIVLQAIYDGTTLMTELVAGGKYPLIQKYKLGENKVIPDYNNEGTGKIDNGDKPILYPFITRTDTNTPPTIISLTYYYNGVKVAVVKTVGSGQSTLEGVNKWDTSGNYELGVVNKYDADNNLTGTNKFDLELYSVKFGTLDIDIPALRIVKNLVDLTSLDGDGINLDTDIISCDGVVEVDGFQVNFQEIRREFKIMEDTGNKYTLWLETSNLGQFTETNQSVTVTAHADVDGDLVQDAIDGTNYYIEWYKADPTSDDGYTRITSGVNSNKPAEYSLSVGDVDSVITIRAVLFKKGGTRCASALTDVHDLTDPYEIRWEVTDNNADGKVDGFVLRKGGSAKVSASVVASKTGIVNWNTTNPWKFLFTYYDNNGVMMKNMPTITQANNETKYASAVIGYDKVRDAGRRITVYGTATRIASWHQNNADAQKFVAEIADSFTLDANQSVRDLQQDALACTDVQNAIYNGATFGTSQKQAVLSALVTKGYTAKS